MNKRSKIILLGVLIAAAAAALWMLGNWKHMRGQERHTVAVITKSTESAFFKSVFAGANAAGTEYNLNLILNGPEKEEDYESQNEMIRQAVSQGAEAIVFSAVDYNANAAAVDEAVAAGVPVVVIDSDVNSARVTCRIGTDNYEAGRMAGEAALAEGNEDLYVGIVNFDANTANGQEREEGLRSRLEEEDRVQEIRRINVLSTTEDARAGTVKLLEENPQINVVVTFNEWTSLGVGWGIRDLGLQDQTRVVVFDSNVVSVGMLETGEVDALVVQNPYAMGYLGVECAYEILMGKTPARAQVDTETTVVTRENMFLPEYQKILFLFD